MHTSTKALFSVRMILPPFLNTTGCHNGKAGILGRDGCLTPYGNHGSSFPHYLDMRDKNPYRGSTVGNGASTTLPMRAYGN
ncbi:hypothetical protein L0P88_08735 [Muricauda sp. SCSIO 64092]|uniref:hypothetical protein n=1 Tax=Allomuricauda sp. SCSIO 64092 TaxID=2908842 RepID=UPI001FF526EC|nr:hypothetical protein [Muricauda sp. SCSIO 64092]UOY08625.1 hypothetical protein L0P88_08735 [Muricauda sp. SCSIO 64092]